MKAIVLLFFSLNPPLFHHLMWFQNKNDVFFFKSLSDLLVLCWLTLTILPDYFRNSLWSKFCSLLTKGIACNGVFQHTGLTRIEILLSDFEIPPALPISWLCPQQLEPSKWVEMSWLWLDKPGGFSLSSRVTDGCSQACRAGRGDEKTIDI